jgi:hypothetical protein
MPILLEVSSVIEFHYLWDINLHLYLGFFFIYEKKSLIGAFDVLHLELLLVFTGLCYR